MRKEEGSRWKKRVGVRGGRWRQEKTGKRKTGATQRGSQGRGEKEGQR